MTTQDILNQLAGFGDESTRKTLMKHGAREPLYGVKVADLKKILKKTKKNHELSLELYQTGNSDAMYLAGLMADEKRMTPEILDDWVKKAYWSYLSEYAVPWVASETSFGFEQGLKWIESKEETIASAGWSTLSFFAALHDDKELDMEYYGKLLDRVAGEVHSAPNRVKYTMNGFIVAVGSYIEPLTAKALAIADKIGTVQVDMGGTACKVPTAKDYIRKVIDNGTLGKKRKSARC